MEERTDKRIADIIQTELWELRDEGYRDFHAKLIPTLRPERLIQIEAHQHPYSKADGVGLRGGNPPADGLDKLLCVPGRNGKADDRTNKR